MFRSDFSLLCSNFQQASNLDLSEIKDAQMAKISENDKVCTFISIDKVCTFFRHIRALHSSTGGRAVLQRGFQATWSS